MEYLNLSERPENMFVRTLMVIFGILCLFTAGWWAFYLYSNPGDDNSFWFATLFLFFFGLYQVYAGLGYARRYLRTDGERIEIKQSALPRTNNFTPAMIESIELRRMDILIKLNGGERCRIKIGIRYPELGDKLRNMVISYSENNSVALEYNDD